jgi:predicted nucleotidyltransferase
LVDPIPEKTTYISLISIKMEISELIGVNVDVFTPDTLKDDVYKTALQETIDI